MSVMSLSPRCEEAESHTQAKSTKKFHETTNSCNGIFLTFQIFFVKNQKFFRQHFSLMIFDDSLDLYQAVGPVPVGVVIPEVFVDEKPPEVGTA